MSSCMCLITKDIELNVLLNKPFIKKPIKEDKDCMLFISICLY